MGFFKLVFWLNQMVDNVYPNQLINLLSVSMLSEQLKRTFAVHV